MTVSHSLEETRALAGRLAAEVRAEHASSIFIGLTGDLGAGKTAFVQGFVAALDPGAEIAVTSPTFSIVQIYDTEPPVTHMDLYRLGSIEELEAIGYRDHYFSRGVTLVEWCARVPEALPAEWIEISLAVLPSDVREIGLRAHGARFQALIERVLS
jgi:tRNA threonylcarbamoyladenosine biosynthesis protein TsaE